MEPLAAELSAEPAIHAALARSSGFRALQDERALLTEWQTRVQREVEALGGTVTAAASRDDLGQRLADPEPGETLVLFAHQDDRAIHLVDGPCTRDELPVATAHGAPHASIDLAVCFAGDPHNLASRVQDLGCPVLTCRRHRAQLGGALFTWMEILHLLREGARVSLPELHELAWLRLHGHRLV